MVWVDWRIFTDRWLQRAERGNVCIDDGDRYVSLWIAFNGWMRGRYGEATSDRDQIESVKRMDDFKRVFTQLREDSTSFRGCLDKLKRVSVINMQFRSGREEVHTYDGSFESLIEVIYQVRCNLFHGRKDIDEDRKDIELLTLAYQALLPLIKSFFDDIE